MIRRYVLQVELYTGYFVKVALANLGLLVYTVCLPIIFLILNNQHRLFRPTTLGQYTNQVMPFMAWIIFTNTLVAVSSIVTLRERGYLKQYRTLVVDVSVILMGQLLANLGLLLITMLLLGVVSGWVFQLPPLLLAGRLVGTLLLVYLPIVCYCLPLLTVALRLKSLNAVVNGVSLLVMFGSVGIAAVINVSLHNFWLNLISPVYLILNTFWGFTQADLRTWLWPFGGVLIGLLLVGLFCYRRIRLLPTEEL